MSEWLLTRCCSWPTKQETRKIKHLQKQTPSFFATTDWPSFQTETRAGHLFAGLMTSFCGEASSLVRCVDRKAEVDGIIWLQ